MAPAVEPRVVKAGFHARVYAVVRQVPAGFVTTYGQVATLLGSPRVARHVGFAMAALSRSREETVPWHRVINSQGRISYGGADGVGDFQRQLLEDEGVCFDARQRVDLRRFLYTFPKFRPPADKPPAKKSRSRRAAVELPSARTSQRRDTSMATFKGFSEQTTTFLRELGRHNEKAWFDAHRAEYDEHYIAPAKAFVAALGDKLATIAPAIVAEPKVNGSIFRINRDVRFSRDKRPYKDHLDLWFWEGADRKQGSSGFFFRLLHDRVLVGAGMHGFPKEKLAIYREKVAADKSGKALAAIAKKLAKGGSPVEGQSYKRVPKGYPADHPRADLLRHGALHAGVTMEPLPEELSSAKFVTLCMRHFRRLAPLHRWIVDELSG